MGSSVIGALRVDLGLNSAAFTAGLTKAQTKLQKFGGIAGKAFAIVAASAVAVGGALAVAVKGSIDHADALSKSAQKAGVSVEALSRLEYAAKLSDISLEGLTGGLNKLNKSMADAAGNAKGQVATAFKALGISVTDANGQLRDTNDVFYEVADRFSRMEDGATKSALAMQIFGKSGAELIPLLNGGAAGLKALADESDRTGNTISTKTARAAEEFNDNLTRLGQVLQGLANKLMEALLPALSAAAEWLSHLDGNTIAIGGTLVSLGAILGPIALGFDGIAKSAKLAAAAIIGVGDAMVTMATKIGTLPTLALAILSFYFGSTTPAGGANEDQFITDLNKKHQAMKDALAVLSSQLGGGATSDTSNVYDGIFVDTSFKPPTFGSGGAGSTDKPLEPLDLGISDVNDGLTEMQQLGQQVGSTLADVFGDLVDTLWSGGDALGAILDDLKNIGKQLLNQGLNSIFSSIFGALTGSIAPGFGIDLGGGNIVPAGWGFNNSTPHFAKGGSGVVGGYGGIDSQLFTAWVTPGEPFAFGDDAIDGIGGGRGGNATFNITGSKADAAAIAQVVGEVMRQQLPSAIQRYQRNPSRRG